MLVICVFSKHPFDLGKAKGIQMKIPITSEEPHIQKYIPLSQFQI